MVTGACGGLGRAIAVALGSSGVDVVVHYNTSSLATAEVAWQFMP